jgi:NADH-quinone oxidoreductase subunit J
MTTPLFLFYLCALLAIAGGLGVIGCKNPVHSALCMIGCMVSLAIIYLLHNAEFIFAIQLMVYAGAVMMLIIFVIFLLDVRDEEKMRTRLKGIKVVSVAAGGLIFLALMVPVAGSVTGKKGAMTDGAIKSIGSVELLAEELFTNYLLPFEVASLVLLVGLVGAVMLAKKKL